MFKKIIPFMVLIAVFITACAGQPAEPTLSAEEVQNTAIAGALTIVAQTQAAIPTATPLPPTETPSPTPLPTFTLLPSPTADLTILPTATTAPSTSSGGGGACSSLLNLAEAGPQSNVRLVNETDKGTVGVSLYMGSPNAFAQCGSMPGNPYTLAPKGSLTISLPKGTYFAYAWITYPDGSQATSTGYFTNKVADDHLFRVIITDVNIVNKQ